ncbi:MAG: tRNA guanosine(34) transglycosylase Tgt [Planctomycetota bacterium]|nr:MAG: tRNA guanosine(34) transglycosylase Tgt [Planctomycetota bacterium]
MSQDITPAQGLGFELLASEVSAQGRARRGRFTTHHGVVETPAFMPVGTQAALKGVLPDQVAASKAQVVLANTYHMGNDERIALVERHNGLHNLMRWPHTILTDSGGFQVFSLKDRTISEDGVTFGFQHGSQPTLLTPERSMAIQRSLGADIVMAFDECIDHTAAKPYIVASCERTLRWLQRCAGEPLQAHQHLFGIIQGGLHLDLRERAVEQVCSVDLPGYAIGGVSVGEGHEELKRVVGHTAPLMPEDRPRYLMGVGHPEDLIESVARGMDMFDCVVPTRYGREGTVFTWRGKLRLKDKRFRKDRYPIDTSCSCPACSGGFSRAYLRHLLYAGEAIGETLCSLHNLWFYQQLMQAMREAISAGTFAAWREDYYAGRLPQQQG